MSVPPATGAGVVVFDDIMWLASRAVEGNV